MKDYSQSGEQEAILSAVEGLPVGRFLDIGAGDGESFSNTRALALAGWQGVCVEPAAWALERLIALYADTHHVRVCQAVVTERCGLTTFLYTKDDHLSTVELAEADKWKEVPFREMAAATATIAQVLDWFELGASVVSIDAEGRSTEIAHDYQRHSAWEQVRVLCVEKEHRAVNLSGAWQLVGDTPNNWIWRRLD